MATIFYVHALHACFSNIVHQLRWLLSPTVSWIFTVHQNAKFKSSKYVSTKKPQYKKGTWKFWGLQYPADI